MSPRSSMKSIPLAYKSVMRRIRFNRAITFNKYNKNQRTQKSKQMSAQTDILYESPTMVDKYILVFSGQFESLKDVPPTLTVDTLNKYRTKLRIVCANIMLVFVTLGTLLLMQNNKDILTGDRFLQPQAVSNIHEKVVDQKKN